ncbi:MAG: DMT family transporter [Chloroflexota bacterium]|nr:DMT family transporter [Chloroflexota bacterium]
MAAMQTDQWRGLGYAGVAVAFFSTSPVLTLWADPLSPFVKTGGRLAVAALVLGVAWAVSRRSAVGGRQSAVGSAASATASVAIQNSELRTQNSSRAALRFAGYGLIAALHFLCYVASLSYTSPAHSLTLVYTAPIWVAGAAALLLHEPIRRRAWGGIAVALLGIGVLVNPLADNRAYPLWWLGDALALGSALTFGLYSVAGRYERARTSLFGYATAVYGLAALWLLPSVWLNWPTAAGPPVLPSAWLAVLGLGVLPLALGHTLYNAALRRLHAATANLIAAQEVTGGVLLSWALLGLAPGPTALLGAAITLGGIVLVLRAA